MATLNEIAYNIADGLEKPYDISFIDRVKFSVIYYRSALLVRDIERSGQIPSSYIQDLGCVTVTKGDLADCCDTTVTVGCPVYKTAVGIPISIPLKGYKEYLYVGGIGQNKPYKFVQLGELVYALSSKYIGEMPMWTRHPNGKVYVFNQPSKQINIKGVFDDPRVAADFNKCSGEACYSDDDDFPITGKLTQMITTGLLSGELQLVEREDEKVEINE